MLDGDDRLPEKGNGDYQYLIPLDADSKHLMVRLAKRKGRIVERDRDADAVRKNPGMVLYRTKDDRGRLQAVGDEYLHSTDWEYPFGPGAMGRVAVRYNGAKGAIPVYDRWGGEHYIHVKVETGMTLTEARESRGEIRRMMEEKASKKLRERVRKAEEEGEPIRCV